MVIHRNTPLTTIRIYFSTLSANLVFWQHLKYFSDNADPREGTADISVPKREMLFIRDNLVSAESARRRGDTAAVYKAYNR